MVSMSMTVNDKFQFYVSSFPAEVNLLWATHQVHHSSEHFNLTTALRQSVPQLYFHTVSVVVFYDSSIDFDGQLLPPVNVINCGIFLTAPLYEHVSQSISLPGNVSPHFSSSAPHLSFPLNKKVADDVSVVSI